ncbi:MAG: hypothetical protein DVB26_02290 [Verrucomicrobia bacterium]|nr:MAG: hypothetical protein DVB26_02290 [Verrucomicrobiota bacterium]
MKWFIGILILSAGLAGYLTYPTLRYGLTGLSNKQPASLQTRAAAADTASPSKASAPVIDLAKLTPDQLPAQVTLKVATEVGDASGLKMKIDSGSRLTLVRVEGDEVVVSPGSSPFEGRVPVTGTDLMEQLEAKPPVVPADQLGAAATPAADPATPAADPATPATDPATPATDPATTAADPATPATDPATTAADPATSAADPATTAADPATSAADPATPAAGAAAPTAEPVAAAEPAAESGTAAAPAAAAHAGTLTDVVEVMKAHLRSGAIKEFSFEQVQEWKAGAAEVVGGRTYQTGLARYSAETVVGAKIIEAKALIQAGKIVRWVWSKNPGMEIK